MRSYTVWGEVNGVETQVSTVCSAEQGKAVHQQMKIEGHYDVMRVRDVFGNLCFAWNLQTDQKVH
jgi:hypothetical protein